MNSDTARSKKVNFDTNDYVHVLSDSPKRLVPRAPSGLRRLPETKSIMKKSPRHIRFDSQDHYRLQLPLDRVVDSSSSNSDSFLPMVSPRGRLNSMSNSDDRSPMKLSSGHQTPTGFDFRAADGWKSATLDHTTSDGAAAINMHMLKLPGGRIFDTVRTPTTERSMDKSASARNFLLTERSSYSTNASSSGGRSATSMRSYSPDNSDGQFHYDARVEHMISKYKYTSPERPNKARREARPRLDEKTAGVSMTIGEVPEMTKIHRKHQQPYSLQTSRSEANLNIDYKFMSSKAAAGRLSPDPSQKMDSASRVQSTVDSIIRSKKNGLNLNSFRMSVDYKR